MARRHRPCELPRAAPCPARQLGDRRPLQRRYRWRRNIDFPALGHRRYMMRAFIVDDEAPARAKLHRWLGKHPDVEIAGEFADGLSAAQGIIAGSPDVVFLDVQMPGLSGLEVASQLEPDDAPL